MRLVLHLGFVAFLWPVFASAGVEDATVTSGNWHVYVPYDYGKDRTVELQPATSPLAHYRENLEAVSPEFVDPRCERYVGSNDPREQRTITHPFESESLTVTEIGPWYDYIVYDVANERVKHRSIVLKDKNGNCRILVTQPCWAALEWKAPRFVKVNHDIVLTYRAETGGSGAFQVEYYFVFDPSAHLPRLLDLSVIEKALHDTLPEALSVVQGGGFDITSLSFARGVSRKDDPNCCPSAGRVTLKLAIDQLQLMVTEAHYDPEAVWP